MSERIFPTVMAAAKATGLSVRNLGSVSGVPHGCLQHWLLGKEPAAFEHLEMLAESLGLKLVVMQSATRVTQVSAKTSAKKSRKTR